jgi:hypothetical protein
MPHRNSSPLPWQIEGLPASGPDPKLADKLSLFGQFVGDWDIVDWRNQQDDGSWVTGRGSLHWRWILEGRAVQDVWATIEEKTGRSIPLGTTIRFYDPRIDAWHSIWISPINRVARVFLARQVGDEIVLEGTSARGNPLHWIFSEITSDSFRWREEELRTPVDGWVMDEEMRIRRRRA